MTGLFVRQFYSIQRSNIATARTPRFTLLLAGGDRLVGEPGAVVNEQLTWISPALGKVAVPFNRLVRMSRGLETAAASDESSKQDVVTLGNGDTIAGVFTASGDGNVTIQTDAGSMAIPISNITRINFAATGIPTLGNLRAFRIHLADSSVITVSDASTDEDQLNFSLPVKGAPPARLPLKEVSAIEQINGPVSWLSSHGATEDVQIPYLPGALHWPARFDSAVDGFSLGFDDHFYNHGIGVHAYSRISFSIDPQWTAFRTQYAIDSHRDAVSKFADVTVRVKLDGRVVHEATHVREGIISPVTILNLKGAKTLTLECDYGGAGDTQARLNWLQPALLRDMPAPSTMP